MTKHTLLSFLFVLLSLYSSPLVKAKTLIAPHAVVNSEWSFGVVVVNTGEENDVIRYELWCNGELVRQELITIGAHQRWLLNGFTFTEGIYIIILHSCSDDTYGHFIRFWQGIPVSETPLLSDFITPNLQSYNCYDSRSWTTIGKSSFYSMGGKCKQMGKWHWKRFHVVLYEMYMRYKDKKGIDPRPSLGDASAKV